MSKPLVRPARCALCKRFQRGPVSCFCTALQLHVGLMSAPHSRCPLPVAEERKP